MRLRHTHTKRLFFPKTDKRTIKVGLLPVLYNKRTSLSRSADLKMTVIDRLYSAISIISIYMINRLFLLINICDLISGDRAAEQHPVTGGEPLWSST